MLEDAADAGSRQSGDGLVTVGRGKGYSDSHPVESIALDPRRSQIRQAARRAGIRIEEAEATLEEAPGVLANGFLRPRRVDRGRERRAVYDGTD
jgi:hypothetical protein